jgi:hypothetical protein
MKSVFLSNAISFAVGTFLAYLSVLVVGFVAAAPIPELLKPYPNFVAVYWPNIELIALSTAATAILVALFKKAFGRLTTVNLLCFTFPLLAYAAYVAGIIGTINIGVTYFCVTAVAIAGMYFVSARKI